MVTKGTPSFRTRHFANAFERSCGVCTVQGIWPSYTSNHEHSEQDDFLSFSACINVISIRCRAQALNFCHQRLVLQGQDHDEMIRRNKSCGKYFDADGIRYQQRKLPNIYACSTSGPGTILHKEHTGSFTTFIIPSILWTYSQHMELARLAKSSQHGISARPAAHTCPPTRSTKSINSFRISPSSIIQLSCDE